MTPTPKQPLWQRLAARWERSQQVFLLGLVLAFAIEIIVDWHTTLYEIKVLRAALRDKACHFAAVLRLAANEAVAARDSEQLRALGERVLGDREVIYVRFSDATGVALAEVGEPLAARYPRQLARDIKRMLASPARLRASIAASTHRDVVQVITDFEEGLVRKFVPAAAPPPLSTAEAALAYQDRLYNERTGKEDGRVTWALGRIGDRNDKSSDGVILVALRTTALHKATRTRVLKGIAITVFFLAVILIQQLSARRAKLQLLSLRDTLAAARRALRAALPERPPVLDGLDGALIYEQAERLGGTVYDVWLPPDQPRCLDVFIASPEGSGVDVALVAVFVRDEHRRLRRAHPELSPADLLTALIPSYQAAPIHRRLCLQSFRVDLGGRARISGAVCGMDPPLIVDEDGVALRPPVTALPLLGQGGTSASKPELAALIALPLQRFEHALPPSSLILVYDDGRGPDARVIGEDELVRRVTAADERNAHDIVTQLRTLALKRAATLADDLLIMAFTRDPQESPSGGRS